LYFANWADQRIYLLPTTEGAAAAEGEAEPVPLTAEPSIPAGWRYADGCEHPDGTWIACVREDHHGIGAGDRTEAANEIVAIAVAGAADGTPAEPVVLVSGSDFVSTPRFSPDGRWLSWVQWDHPNMPWETTTLCAVPVFADMRIGNVQTVAAGRSNPSESIHGADWTADGRLVFSSDDNGYWNLYSWTPGSDQATALTELTDAEIGGPAWNFGTQRWVELSDGRLVVVITRQAEDSLAVLDGAPSSNGPAPLQPLATPGLGELGGLHAVDKTTISYVGSGPTSLATIVLVNVDSWATAVLRPADDLGVSDEWFSRPEAVEFSSAGRRSHCFFYPPTGADLEGAAGELPPLIVMGHGGPTAHSGPGLSSKIQFWTSRGFAVADVNYGGSSGFGRAYRDLLQGQWGIVDVEDCINAATHLAETGRVDGARLAIRGGSAGGFTVLTALIESDMFAAGTSLYGVADLTALAADTHKFESRYLDGMIGPYPERRDLYEERSPINRTEGLSSPLLVLQGTEDEIVPPSQSEAIVAALAAKGVPHAYVAFEGEQHGFRMAENIIRSLEVELWFYGRVLGIKPADPIEPPAGAVGLS
jgi:dipeptidyl aminopeptidase/acylaminoacyl peptidase